MLILHLLMSELGVGDCENDGACLLHPTIRYIVIQGHCTP